MFKSVEYCGFEGRGLLKQLAERASLVLTGIIRSWREEVIVTWRPHEKSWDPVLELTLSLDLPNGTHTATGILHQKDFEQGEETLLRMDLREVWLNLLDSLIAKVSSDVEESLANPVEV